MVAAADGADVIGFVGGFAAGLVGIGGAIVLIPMLLDGPPLLGMGSLGMHTVAGITMVQVALASTLALVAVALLPLRMRDEGAAVSRFELPPILVVSIGIVAGVLLGMIGAGGGFLLVPVLLWCFASRSAQRLGRPWPLLA